VALEDTGYKGFPLVPDFTVVGSDPFGATSSGGGCVG
jgi:hypothetical protein